MENLCREGTWRLRTAEGWVAERAAEDPDKFFLERLQQHTCDFAGSGAGPERCVFADTLRLSAASEAGERYVSRSPDARCVEVVRGERYAVVVKARRGSAGDDNVDGMVDGGAGATVYPPQFLGTQSAAPSMAGICGEEGEGVALRRRAKGKRGGGEGGVDYNGGSRPTRSLLAHSVEVGDVDAVTVFVELFVPGEAAVDDSGPRQQLPQHRRSSAGGVRGAGWRWGIVLGDFDVYLSIQRRPARMEADEGIDGVATSEDDGVRLGEANGEGLRLEDGVERDGGGDESMHLVIDGPGGCFHALPVCSAFRGRWMTLRVVARRSGESLLACTPGVREGEEACAGRRPEDTTEPGLESHGATSASASVAQNRQLRCTFSNPRFFRGDRVSCVGLYSESSRRSDPSDNHGGQAFPFRARHVAVLLGSVEESPPPVLPRLRHLERILAIEHSSRLEEPVARPLLVFARRLHSLWSGEIPVSCSPEAFPAADEGRSPAALSTPALAGIASSPAAGAAGAAAPSVASQSPGGAGSFPRLTVWQALLSPGRVALGSAVSFGRSGGNGGGGGCGADGGSVERAGSEEPAGAGSAPSVHRRCLTAWEHPALQTPARFESVPLPSPMTAESHREGQGGLWAWAPVPRSEGFLAVGLVFTCTPEPPALTAVRCVRRELVKDANPHKCKVWEGRGLLVLSRFCARAGGVQAVVVYTVRLSRVQ